MLTLTDNATTIVKDIASSGGAATAGLRITTTAPTGSSNGTAGTPTPSEPTYAIAAAAEPEPGDQVVEQDGATVYLDQPAASQLDDKVLDAGLDPNGNIQFSLGLQA